MVMSRGLRAQIAIPAQGLIEFKDQLAELLDLYGQLEEQSKFSGLLFNSLNYILFIQI
jgi:hypothetical protein